MFLIKLGVTWETRYEIPRDVNYPIRRLETCSRQDIDLYPTSLLLYFEYLTISTVTFQTVKTLVRELLEEPSDLGLHFLKKSSLDYKQAYKVEADKQGSSQQ